MLIIKDKEREGVIKTRKRSINKGIGITYRKSY